MKKTGLRVWLALFMIAGLVLAMAPSAGARSLSGPLPPYKEAGSYRFDFSGSAQSVDSVNGNTSIQLSGSGAVSGKDSQADIILSVELPQSASYPDLPKGPISSTISTIQVDGKSYLKVSSPDVGANDQWIELDSGGATGTSPLAGMSGTGLLGSDPAVLNAISYTQVGKEQINGAATTKYRIDVDYQKLLAAAASLGGASPATPPTPAPQVSLSAFVWIGDSDMYVRKLTISASGTDTTGGASTKVALDITVNFRDFDTPITITAPANAQKIDVSALGNASSFPIISGGGMLGMPGSMTTGIEMGMPRMGGMAGMPRTGRNWGDGVPFVPIAVVVLGLLCVGAGGVTRKVSVAARHTERD